MNEHEAGDTAWRDDDELDALLLAAKMTGLETLHDALHIDGAISRHRSDGHRQSVVPGSAAPDEGMRRSLAPRSPPDAVD